MQCVRQLGVGILLPQIDQALFRLILEMFEIGAGRQLSRHDTPPYGPWSASGLERVLSRSNWPTQVGSSLSADGMQPALQATNVTRRRQREQVRALPDLRARPDPPALRDPPASFPHDLNHDFTPPRSRVEFEERDLLPGAEKQLAVLERNGE